MSRRPTNSGNSRTKTFRAGTRCRWLLLGIFLSPTVSLFILPLSDIGRNAVSKSR